MGFLGCADVGPQTRSMVLGNGLHVLTVVGLQGQMPPPAPVWATSQTPNRRSHARLLLQRNVDFKVPNLIPLLQRKLKTGRRQAWPGL